MKELQLLESWADSIIANEAVQDRPLTRDQDIQYQASRKYSDRSPEQALQMYVADKLASSEQMDYEQNKLINAQKRENEKLRRSLQDLGQELTDHERVAQDTEQQVQRLKDLSAKLRPAGEIQQATTKASADKVEAMLADVEKLKTLPGMDEKKYKELVDKVNQIKQGAGDEEVQKVQLALAVLSQKQQVDDQMFNTVMARLDDTQTKLDAKELRFRKYITKKSGDIEAQTRTHGDELKKYSQIVNKYKEELDGFSDYMNTTKKEVDNSKKEVEQAKLEVGQAKLEVEKTKQEAIALTNELEFRFSPEVRKSTTRTKKKRVPSVDDMFKASSKEINKLKPNASPSDVAAATKAGIAKPAKTGPDISKLDTDFERQRSFGMQAQDDKEDPKPMNEDLRQYDDADFLEWAMENVPIIIRHFYSRYPELENTIPKEQVRDMVEKYLPYLYQYDDVDVELMNTFLDIVNSKIKKQGKIPVQKDLFSLEEQFEHELDKLIGLEYIK